MMDSRKTIKYLIFIIPRFFYYYHFLRNRQLEKAVVLTYHGILPQISSNKNIFEFRNFVTISQFERQIRFFLKYYRPLRVEDFANSSRNIGGGFLITFDDGFRNNYKYALPVLNKYELQGCFFITTEFIGTRHFIWIEKVTRLITMTNRPELELELDGPKVFKLNSPQKIEYASQFIRKFLKRLPIQQRQSIVEEMKSRLSDVPEEMTSEEEERYIFMSWDEIKEIVNKGHIIGSHTHTHPILATLSSEESYLEFKISKESIEEKTNHRCIALSYPNGEKEDFLNIHKEQLKELGYQCAFTQIPLFSTYNSDPYELCRTNVTLKTVMPVLEAKLCGFKK